MISFEETSSTKFKIQTINFVTFNAIFDYTGIYFFDREAFLVYYNYVVHYEK